MTPKVISVNISEKKGTVKNPVPKIELTPYGVAGDAHAGDWQRQVSLLAKESFERFESSTKRKTSYGEFAENITTEGIELHKLNILDKLKIGEVLLEVTQIGKECHGTSCAIYNEVGNCVMPKEGIFARVLQNGSIAANMDILLLKRSVKLCVIVLSDRASKGEYTDRSGIAIQKMMENFFEKNDWNYSVEYHLIPDSSEQLTNLLIEQRKKQTDIIITTGGTGISPRDITPETVKPLLDKEIPGIMEMIRWKYGQNKPNALLSRGIAGVMGNSLVYTLPGSLKAITEYITEIQNTLQHLIFMLHRIDAH